MFEGKPPAAPSFVMARAAGAALATGRTAPRACQRGGR
eukprot:CAMPEP_0176145298 /NCGR_PEP_ID=MMETSP0120_2-20121206/74002_1 /TAXON_ID=160619 /ORGANISM="Kryptoperidinium foliaceum, Strain CCMP 1326" /LENGTH=37 /DNA_ID= /DNA_START= /DNA_END= /DNA_ORIENTATION=